MAESEIASPSTCVCMWKCIVLIKKRWQKMCVQFWQYMEIFGLALTHSLAVSDSDGSVFVETGKNFDHDFWWYGKGWKGMRDEMSNRTKNSSSRQNENAWTNEASAQKISYNISTSTRNTEERKAEHDGMGRRAVKEWGFAKRVEKGKGVAKKGMKCGSGMSEINENLLCICMRMLLDCPKITHKKREAIIFAFRPRVA